MTRLYGRSLVGERCLMAVPHGHWQTATFIAALRHDRLSAPWVIDAPMDGPLFLAYITKVLGPELQQGDMVICDNLASHKIQGIAEAIAARGATLHYLPAYSPDLNPIEMAFAKLKSYMRHEAARPLRPSSRPSPATSPSSNSITAKASFATPNKGLSKSKRL